MKFTNSLWATTLAAFALLFALPSMASADHGRRCQGSCNRCGNSLYANYVIVGYDRCRQPIYSWVPLAHRCATVPPVGFYGRPVYRGPVYGYGASRGACPDRFVRRPVCPPARGGVRITFGY